MTAREALTEGAKFLKSPSPSALIDTAELDTSILLAGILKVTRTELFTRVNNSISEEDWAKLKELLERRRQGECIAYIQGHREFRGMEFSVNHSVLVPRPDTETLVEAALEYIDGMAKEEKLPISFLDLCTGCGALAVSLKNERPFLSVTASDISKEALEIADLNMKRLLGKELAQGRGDEIKMIHSDLFEKIKDKFDIIVSNPPYVPSGEMVSLAPEVLKEPALALDGGEDGLDLIRKIILKAPEHLEPGGALLLEAGPGQMPTIKVMLEENNFSCVKIQRDLGNRERVISARCL